MLQLRDTHAHQSESHDQQHHARVSRYDRDLLRLWDRQLLWRGKDTRGSSSAARAAAARHRRTAGARRGSWRSTEMSNRASDAARVMDALRRSVRALRSANDGARRRFGIGAAQLFVLREMGDAPGISVAELAELGDASRTNVLRVGTPKVI